MLAARSEWYKTILSTAVFNQVLLSYGRLHAVIPLIIIGLRFGTISQFPLLAYAVSVTAEFCFRIYMCVCQDFVMGPTIFGSSPVVDGGV